jgi:hypothetical protein
MYGTSFRLPKEVALGSKKDDIYTEFEDKSR